jgi:hypothetical protein
VPIGTRKRVATNEKKLRTSAKRVWHTKSTGRMQARNCRAAVEHHDQVYSRRAWPGALIPNSSFVYPLSGANTPIALQQKWVTWQSGMDGCGDASATRDGTKWQMEEAGDCAVVEQECLRLTCKHRYLYIHVNTCSVLLCGFVFTGMCNTF